MPMRFTQRAADGSNDVARYLAQSGGHIVRAINDEMNAQMKAVRDEARRRAPVDSGALEHAIKLRHGNQRRFWSVYVDGSMPDDTGRYTVGDYALRIHEGIGWEHLGPKSEAKAAATGAPVGRKFLENPFREIIGAELLAKLQQAYDKVAAERTKGRL